MFMKKNAEHSTIISSWHRLKRQLQGSHPKLKIKKKVQSFGHLVSGKNANFAIADATFCLAAGMLTRHLNCKTKEQKADTHLSGNEQKVWHKQPVSPTQGQSIHVPKCYVMQLTALVSGDSDFKADCHCTFCAPATSHGCSLMQSRGLPSYTCSPYLRITLARWHLSPPFMSIWSSARGQCGARRTETATGFHFWHRCRGVGIRSRGKGSEWMTYFSFLKKKYLGCCLHGSGLWFLNKWGKILKMKV